MNFSSFNEESAKVVGSIDLSKMRKVVFDPTKTKAHNTMRPGGGNVPHYVTKADLDALEHILDRLFAHYNIDITFTRHFLDRINDARNMEQITIAELQGLFQKAYQKVGAKLPKMAGIEAVLVDIQSKINVPFAMNVGKDGDLELVSKTIMRKNNFITSNPKIKVEQNMKSFVSFISESGLNYSKMASQAQKLHDNAKDGELKLNGIKYAFAFDRHAGVYSVTDPDGEEVLRINSRKIADAKKYFKHYMEN